jgi:hypothetical protein
MRSLAFCWILLVAPAVPAAEPSVDIDLIMRGRVPVTAPQEWNIRLAASGFRRVAIRGLRADDKLEIRSEGSTALPAYRVIGYLMEDGSIVLPPRRQFTLRDAAQLGRWVRELKRDGPDGALSSKTAFGLTPQRLKQVSQDLQQAVRHSTLDADPATLLDQLARQLAHPMAISAAARTALRQADPVREELKGVSVGTALAATLRPAGLVLRPQFVQGKLSYAVVNSRTDGDNWPVGWAADETPSRLIPGLLQKEQTQETQVPLASAVQELGGRIGVPILWDHNGMARQRIDPDRAIVRMQAGKSHYAAILRSLLRQVGMTFEVRVDDDQQPFLWLTTVKGS